MDITVGSPWQMKEDVDFTCNVIEIDDFGVVRTDIPDRKTVGNKYDFAGGFFPKTFLEIFEPRVIKADMVNHPPHYKDESGIECIEVTKHMQFCGGNCFKYLYRAGSKGDLLEDLRKAMWYADYARVHEGRISLFQRLRISKNIKTISKHRYYRISSAMDLILSRDWTWVATEIEYLIRDIESRESLRGEKVTLKNAGSNL